VIIEIGLFDAAFGDSDLSLESGGGAVHNSTIHLRSDGVGIDVAAAIHGADYAVNRYLAGLRIDTDFRNLGPQTSKEFNDGDAPGLSSGKRLSPSGLLRC